MVGRLDVPDLKFSRNPTVKTRNPVSEDSDRTIEFKAIYSNFFAKDLQGHHRATPNCSQTFQAFHSSLFQYCYKVHCWASTLSR